MSGPDKWITSITLQYPPGGEKNKGSEISKVTFSGNPNLKFPTSLGPRHRTMRPSAPGMHPLLAVHRPDTADTHSSGLVCDALLHFIQAMSHRSASQLLEVSLHGFQPVIQGLGNRPSISLPRGAWEEDEIHQP